VRRPPWAALVLVLAATLAACGGDPSDAGATGTAGRGSGIVMTSAERGYAVLPSGDRWVLIGTDDGWRSVTNATPTSVPTDGGLIVAAAGPRVALGVLPHELLTVSPVFGSVDAARRWTPGQLPGGLAAGASLSVSRVATVALLRDAGGSIVGSGRSRGPWRVLATASSLAPGVTLRSVASFPSGLVVVTATGPSAGPLLLDRSSRTSSWHSVTLPAPGSGGIVSVYPPCQVSGGWLVPVATQGSLWLASSSSLSGPWQHGTSIKVGAAPVIACGPTSVWVYTDDSLTLQVGDADRWLTSGQLSEPLTALSVINQTAALATATTSDHLLRVILRPSISAQRIPLPDWVQSVGGGSMGI
jgi:hypothetical protein